MVGWRSVRWLLGCYEAAGGVDCFSEHFHVCLLNSRVMAVSTPLLHSRGGPHPSLR